MKGTNRKILQKAISELRDKEPEPYLWAKIESFLVFESTIDSIKELLPEHEPQEALWAKIDQNLDAKKITGTSKNHRIPFSQGRSLPAQTGIKDEVIKRQVVRSARKLLPMRKIAVYGLSAAAVFIGLLLGWRLLLPQKHENIKISYAIENKQPADSLPAPEKTSQDSERLIRNNCMRKPAICESPDISALEDELDNLDHQREILKEEAGQYGNDDNIMKAYNKIEGEKSKVMKELLVKLKS